MGADSCKAVVDAKRYIDPDRFKSFDELNAALRAEEVESMQLVLGIDFSGSNDNQNLHGMSYKNPYLRILEVLQPVMEHFDDRGEIHAYRFGCA